MESHENPHREEDNIITDLETGKKYRINESGDQVEIKEGSKISVEEFVDLFGYLKLPKAEKSEVDEAQQSPPSSAQSVFQSGPTTSSRLGLRNLVQRTKRRITESHSPRLSKHGSLKDLSPNVSRTVTSNKRSEKCLSDLRLVQELKAHQGVVWVMQFSSDCKLLATGGEDTNVYVWSVVEERKGSAKDTISLPVFDPTPVHVYSGHKSDILDISWAPKSEFLLSASLDKSVRLWHIKHQNCLREFPHSNYVTSIRFHPLDSSRFISGSGDGMLRLWNIAEYKVVATADIASERDIFTALCFSPDGKTIVAGCFDGRCRIYNLNSNRLEKRAEVDVKNRAGKHRKGTKVTGIVPAECGVNTFLVTTHDSRIRLLQATTPPKHICKFKGHENSSGRPIVACPSSNGDYVISGSDDGRVFIWNNISRPFKRQERDKISEHESFQAHNGFCPTARFCPDNCRRPLEHLDLGLPSGGNYHALMKMIGLAPSGDGSLPGEFSLWGQVIITGGSRGEIRVWENFGVPTPQ